MGQKCIFLSSCQWTHFNWPSFSAAAVIGNYMQIAICRQKVQATGISSVHVFWTLNFFVSSLSLCMSSTTTSSLNY